MEEWRPVVGYEGYYIVSNLGNVSSVDRYVTKSNGVVQFRKQRACKPRETYDGYVVVKLSRDGKTKLVPVHRIVAMAFVDGFEDGLEVNHIDHDRKNNNASNLEWLTHQENIAKTIDDGRHISQIADFSGENNPNYGNRKLSEKYASDKDLAMRKQSRRGSSNGSAKPIRMMRCDSGAVIDFDYIRACADYIHRSIAPSMMPQTLATLIAVAARTGEELYGATFSLI